MQSLLRSMDLLEILKETPHKCSISELSEASGLPPSRRAALRVCLILHRFRHPFAAGK